jgi:hypothetical protein
VSLQGATVVVNGLVGAEGAMEVDATQRRGAETTAAPGKSSPSSAVKSKIGAHFWTFFGREMMLLEILPLESLSESSATRLQSK